MNRNFSEITAKLPTTVTHKYLNAIPFAEKNTIKSSRQNESPNEK
jgi:hypothetical protein